LFQIWDDLEAEHEFSSSDDEILESVMAEDEGRPDFSLDDGLKNKKTMFAF